jgi:predicted Na+-dependent transporter
VIINRAIMFDVGVYNAGLGAVLAYINSRSFAPFACIANLHRMINP